MKKYLTIGLIIILIVLLFMLHHEHIELKNEVREIKRHIEKYE